MEQLNSEQQAKLGQLGLQVNKEVVLLIKESSRVPKYVDKEHLVRVLIAREWNVSQAFVMWKKWVEWRLEYRADEITEQDVASEIALGKAYWNGFDRLGNPTLIIKACKHFPGQATQDKFIRFFLFLIEQGIKRNLHFKGIRLADQAGTGKVSVIWDRNGVTSKNFDSSMLTMMKRLVSMLQDNYAERLHIAVVLYPNWFAKSIMAVMKPFLSEKSKSKIKLVEKVEELQQLWHPQQLMVEHGGSNTSHNNSNEKVIIVSQEEELKMNQMAEQILKENEINVAQQ